MNVSKKINELCLFLGKAPETVFSRATDHESLIIAEGLLGHELPPSLREFYSFYNGELGGHGDPRIGIFFGIDALPIKEALHKYSENMYAARTLNAEIKEPFETIPAGALFDGWFSPGWFTFAGRGLDHLAVDYAPTSEGKVGQIVNIGRDVLRRSVIANSFDELLELCASRYGQKKWHPVFGDDNVLETYAKRDGLSF
jgi:cell wall assembly regulator SMI1